MKSQDLQRLCVAEGRDVSAIILGTDKELGMRSVFPDPHWGGKYKGQTLQNHAKS